MTARLREDPFMKNDIKIGVVLGIVIVAVAIYFFVSGNDQSDSRSPDTNLSPGERPSVVEPEPALPVGQKSVSPALDKLPVIEAPQVEPPKPPTVERPKPQSEPELAKPQPRYHIVAKGENLYKISEQYYGHGQHAKVILNANRNIITDPDKLQPGWKLRIPYPEDIIGR